MADFFSDLFSTPEFQDIIQKALGDPADNKRDIAPSKYTKEQIEKRLKDLFDRILDSSSVDNAVDCEVCEDIRYVGQCEGILKSTGTLEKEHLKKLNELWKKYKE